MVRCLHKSFAFLRGNDLPSRPSHSLLCRLQTERAATPAGREKPRTLGPGAVASQPRYLTDTTRDIRDSLTMDIIMAGQDTIIPSQELTKDSSASEDDHHPEPKTWVNRVFKAIFRGFRGKHFHFVCPLKQLLLICISGIGKHDGIRD